jgi:hypothetical protein
MAKVIGLVNLHSDIEFTGLTEKDTESKECREKGQIEVVQQ